MTWKDGIGQYLDNPEVQELAKRLCSKYAQKLCNTSDTVKYEQKSDDKVEPKFKVGDWIISPVLGTARIIGVNDSNEYQLEYIDGKQKFSSIDYVNYAYDKWTIQDAKDGDVLATSTGAFIYNNTSILQAYCYYSNERNRFIIEDRGHHCNWNMGEVTPATKGQCDLLVKTMNEAGYKWDAEKKELKKLIEPKFKVGDRVMHKETNKNDVYEISKVYDDSYGIVGFNWMIYMKYQDQYELVPNKFDPRTLQPFDKVLCRNGIDIWRCDFFSSYNENRVCSNVCIGGSYLNCIPYNDETKYLVGTDNETPKFYRYWED